MIALGTLGVFDGLLRRLDRLGPNDSINPAPRPYDEGAEDDPALAFLTPGAIPADPSRAAIVAVIDDALPFAHERLRLGPDPRVASVWFQDAAPGAGPVGADLPFGRELRGAQIARLIAGLRDASLVDEDALYRAAGILDMRRASPQRLAFAAGHGAAVAGLAAGFGPAEAVARGLPVIAVCLTPHVVRDTLGTAAPFYVMLAILHVVHRARRLCRFIERRRGLPGGSVRLPVVVNLSFGLSAGPKDGSSDLERLMDAVSRAATADLGPVRFVVAAGNHRQARIRARVAANAPEPLEWLVRPDDRTPSFLELWGPARQGGRPVPVQVECRPPGWARPVTTAFAAHGACEVLTRDGQEVARAYLQHRLVEGQTFEGRGREVVTLAVPPTLPERLGLPYGAPGRWRLRLLSPEGGDFDAFVQRDDAVPGFGPERGRQSRLLDDADPGLDAAGRATLRDPPGRAHGVLRAGTVSAFATGREVIRVGGTFAATGAAVPYSGLAMDGPRPEGDVVAPAALSAARPGVRVMGTRSGAHGDMTGTSMAAPLVTRELALAFAEGAVGETGPAALAALLRERLAARAASSPGGAESPRG